MKPNSIHKRNTIDWILLVSDSSQIPSDIQRSDFRTRFLYLHIHISEGKFSDALLEESVLNFMRDAMLIGRILLKRLFLTKLETLPIRKHNFASTHYTYIM